MPDALDSVYLSETFFSGGLSSAGVLYGALAKETEYHEVLRPILVEVGHEEMSKEELAKGS